VQWDQSVNVVIQSSDDISLSAYANTGQQLRKFRISYTQHSSFGSLHEVDLLVLSFQCSIFYNEAYRNVALLIINAESLRIGMVQYGMLSLGFYVVEFRKIKKSSRDASAMTSTFGKN
jgi:hypothetical protein